MQDTISVHLSIGISLIRKHISLFISLLILLILLLFLFLDLDFLFPFLFFFFFSLEEFKQSGYMRHRMCAFFSS